MTALIVVLPSNGCVGLIPLQIFLIDMFVSELKSAEFAMHSNQSCCACGGV
jgi:hypothetical protein